MISHLIRDCAVTWSVHDTYAISALSVTWSVHDQHVISAWLPRKQCMNRYVISACAVPCFNAYRYLTIKSNITVYMQVLTKPSLHRVAFLTSSWQNYYFWSHFSLYTSMILASHHSQKAVVMNVTKFYLPPLTQSCCNQQDQIRLQSCSLINGSHLFLKFFSFKLWNVRSYRFIQLH